MSDLTDFDFDTDLSDVSDLVSYSNPADGTHIYMLRFCGKDLTLGDDPVLGLSMVWQKVGTVELVDADAVDSAVGSLIKENFTGHEMAKKIFKLRLTQIYGKEAIETAQKEGKNLGYFIPLLTDAIAQGFYAQMVTKVVTTKSKKDRNVSYDNLRILDLQPVEGVELPEGFEPYEYEPSLPDSE